jgi:hypothetical protein
VAIVLDVGVNQRIPFEGTVAVAYRRAGVSGDDRTSSVQTRRGGPSMRCQGKWHPVRLFDWVTILPRPGRPSPRLGRVMPIADLRIVPDAWQDNDVVPIYASCDPLIPQGILANATKISGPD